MLLAGDGRQVYHPTEPRWPRAEAPFLGIAMSNEPNELAAMSAIVAAPVVAVEPCGWGFENRTSIVTLADGRRLVVQQLAGRAVARLKLRRARALPERLAAAGLRAPRLLAADISADPPYIVREYLPGDIGARLIGTLAGALHVAGAMGELLPRLAAVPTGGAGLSDAWATPDRLARQARLQLARNGAMLGPAAARALAATIERLPARFADRPACFAHGDFCPVNVLLEATDLGPGASGKSEASGTNPQAPAVIGLLDLEFARIADPLFDAAWWGWVVRYHHPERWAAAYPQLLAAAGISSDEPTRARIHDLQLLRCLEMVDYHARTARLAQAAMWAGRLQQTLGWE